MVHFAAVSVPESRCVKVSPLGWLSLLASLLKVAG